MYCLCIYCNFFKINNKIKKIPRNNNLITSRSLVLGHSKEREGSKGATFMTCMMEPSNSFKIECYRSDKQDRLSPDHWQRLDRLGRRPDARYASRGANAIFITRDMIR